MTSLEKYAYKAQTANGQCLLNTILGNHALTITYQRMSIFVINIFYHCSCNHIFSRKSTNINVKTSQFINCVKELLPNDTIEL